MFVLSSFAFAKPDWSNPQVNATQAGALALFQADWDFTAAIGSCHGILELDNGNGTLQNISRVTNFCGSDPQTLQFQAFLNTTTYSTIRWRLWANDSANPLFNATGLYSFTALPFGSFQVLDEIALTPINYNLTLYNETVTTTLVNRSGGYLNLTGGIIPSGLVTLVFSSTGYQNRQRFLNITVGSNTSLVQYMLSTSAASEADFKVQDYLSNPIPNYTVQVQKFFPSLNSYQTIDEQKTDYAGKTTSWLYQPSSTYRIIILNNFAYVEAKDSVILNSQVQTGTLSNGNGVYYILLTLTGGGNNVYKQFGSVNSSCLFNNGTTVLTCTLVDNSGTAFGSQLQVANLTPTGWVTICNSVATGTTATLLCTIGSGWNTSVFSYALSLRNSDGSYFTVATGTLDFRTTVVSWGTNGLFATLILILAFFMLGVFIGGANPITALLSLDFGLILAYVIGAFDIGLGGLISLLVVSVLIMWRSRA